MAPVAQRRAWDRGGALTAVLAARRGDGLLDRGLGGLGRSGLLALAKQGLHAQGAGALHRGAGSGRGRRAAG
jgi:hypothetical protein